MIPKYNPINTPNYNQINTPNNNQMISQKYQFVKYYIIKIIFRIKELGFFIIK